MSTLDIKDRNRILRYLGAVLFLLLFARIYNYFGHGVESDFMNFAFVPPLLALIWCVMQSVTRTKFIGFAGDLMGCGIFTLSMGMILNGIFQIAGTDSDFVTFYWWAGGILVLLSALITAKVNRKI